MKKTHTVRTFAAGFLAALLLVGVIPSAIAAVAGMNITVYPGISIYMDDQKLNPTDANGKAVEVFNYNGTVYLPVRAVSEALGKTVQWDGTTRSVYIGKHASTTPAVMLKDLDYFSGTSSGSFYTAASEKDNTGATHYNCITRGFDRTYQLNGQYTRLSGVLYQTYERRSNTTHGGNYCYLEIYGDGVLLYSRAFEEGETGIIPIPFSIDLTGVLSLQVKFGAIGRGCADILSLGDVGLYT